jgi:hypothetical protein
MLESEAMMTLEEVLLEQLRIQTWNLAAAQDRLKHIKHRLGDALGWIGVTDDDEQALIIIEELFRELHDA